MKDGFKNGKVRVTSPSTFEYREGDGICIANVKVSPPDDGNDKPEGMVWHGIFQRWMTFEDANKEYWVDPKEIGLTDKDLNMDEDEDVEQ